MVTHVDDQGRIRLPEDVRERFGTEYRVVELPNYVALFPVADDPLAAVRETVDDEFEGKNVDQLREEARKQ